MTHESFFTEVFPRFRFLVDEFGLRGPVAYVHSYPHVRYHGRGFTYLVYLFDRVHSPDRTVMVVVRPRVPAGTPYTAADLNEVVHAAGLADRVSVLSSAETHPDLVRSLDSQAAWLRAVHPLVTGADGIALVRLARRKGRVHPPG